jgi:hypothetical protein
MSGGNYDPVAEACRGTQVLLQLDADRVEKNRADHWVGPRRPGSVRSGDRFTRRTVVPFRVKLTCGHTRRTTLRSYRFGVLLESFGLTSP